MGEQRIILEQIPRFSFLGSKIDFFLGVKQSLPPEPYEINNPFGGHDDIENAFISLCSRADKLICVSEAEKVKLESIIDGVQGKTEVICNGLTFDNYNFKRKIRDARTKLGYLGRLDYRKGILETLMALKNYKELHYYIASGKGDFNYLKELKQYIEASGMEDRIHFLGYCIGARRDSFLKEIDCLIISSLYEPFGMILLEALQANVPIICSNNGGLAEMLGDYKYQYNPYVEADLEKIIQIFNSDSVENIESECCKLKERLKLFTNEIMVERYKRVLEDILQ
jgi:glycosyltransferase involved in cell wall biosynthesis